MIPLALTGMGVAVGCRMLAGTYTLFQHAYLNSYWALPGAHVGPAYWASVRFAFQQTCLVAVGVGVLGSLAAWEVVRAAGR